MPGLQNGVFMMPFGQIFLVAQEIDKTGTLTRNNSIEGWLL